MLYQKLYAYLVGQVEDSLQLIADDLMRGSYGREELIAVGEKLKSALLQAEETYIQADDIL